MTPKEIQQLRLQLKMTKREFSRMLAVDMRTIKRWEDGESRPQGMAGVFLSLLHDFIETNIASPDRVNAFKIMLKTAGQIGGFGTIMEKLITYSYNYITGRGKVE